MKKTLGWLLLSFAVYSSQASAGFLGDLFDLSGDRLKRYANTQDKELVDVFYTLTPDGKTEGLVEHVAKEGFTLEKLTKTSLSIYKPIFRESNMGYIASDMRKYSFDPTSDILAQKYIAFVKARGNVVKLYKPKMGEIINTLFKVPFQPMQQTAEWYDLDNALIEYDKTGSPVSFMARAHQARTTVGVDSYQYTSIYFGKENCRHLENNTRNSDFQEYVIRDL